jgi:hypothetical protein
MSLKLFLVTDVEQFCINQLSRDLFGGKKTIHSCSGLYTRAYGTFQEIVQFEKATQHLRQPTSKPLTKAQRKEDWERRLTTATSQHEQYPHITVRVLEQWYRTGWCQIFVNRYVGIDFHYSGVDRSAILLGTVPAWLLVSVRHLIGSEVKSETRSRIYLMLPRN